MRNRYRLAIHFLIRYTIKNGSVQLKKKMVVLCK
jgi:hypothetical protein